jgi:ATP-binding cassette, subfamily B, bacterial
VCFDNVDFAYGSRQDTPALRSFSLSVSPGEKVALVGPSGAGKSTVFQLLLRFYDPERGKILFDGVDIRTVSPSDLRARIGVVLQDPVIFAADAWDNIRFGCPTASDEDVRNAAATAGILDFLEQLPDGLSTYLGERGTSLSGGQRQLIAFARAIVRNPMVLLLDEATNALDAENNQRIGEILGNTMAGRTTLIIAHRLATVRRCDRIIVIDDGRVISEGTHDKLRETCPLYKRLSLLEFDEDVRHKTAERALGSLSPMA